MTRVWELETDAPRDVTDQVATRHYGMVTLFSVAGRLGLMLSGDHGSLSAVEAELRNRGYATCLG